MKTLIKKSLLVLMVAFIAVFTLGVSSKVKAADLKYSYAFTAKVYSANDQTITLSDVDWTLSGTNGNYWGFESTKGQQFGSSKKYYSSMSLTSADFHNVTSIKINTSGASSTNAQLTVKVGDVQVGTQKLSSSATDYTFSVDGLSGAVQFSYEQTSEKAIYIKSIEITYSDELSSEPSIKLAGNSYAMVGLDSTLIATPENTDSTVNWGTSDETIATVSDGVVTPLKMGTVVITAILAEDPTVSAQCNLTVYPNNEEELTIEEAIKVCELTGTTNCPFTYSTTGIIESIDSAYNTEYKNIDVTISDGTNSIKAYRMSGGSELSVGQQIKVTGTLVNYNSNTPEFAAKCTYELVIDSSVESAIIELNKIDAYMSLAYKYTVNQQETAIESENTLTFDSTSKRKEYSTDKQVWEENSITVTNEKANSTTNVADYASPARFYKSSSLKVESGIEFTTIKFVCNTAAYATGLKNSISSNDNIEVVGSTVTINFTDSVTSFTIESLSAQVRVDSISIKNTSNETELTNVYSDVDFRIKCGIDLAIDKIEGVDSFGVNISADKEENLQANYEDEQYLYAIISLGDVLTNPDRLDVKFTIKAYVEIEGVKYYSELTKSFSIRELVEVYYDDVATQEKVAALYDLIQNL